MFASLYRIATDLGAPVISLYLRRRLAQGREDAVRFGERLGKASRPRPEGRLVWCHAASVGEAVSLLLLIEKLHDTHPDLTILLTTGTVTAARMMESRLPSYALHQYVPVDRMPYINRFLDHWRPTMALWIESEIWPNILTALKKRKVPTVLLNARMSEKSFRNWYRVKGWARDLMGGFSLCLAQTENDRSRFVALGARPVKCLGNLKYASALLPVDDKELSMLQRQASGCALWLMASTHRGEEEMAIAAHRALAAKHPRVLTIIALRHAARGDEVAKILSASGLRFARRSKGEVIAATTQIYLVDTMGEMGLLYALSPIVVMGGSFARNSGIAGHNPIEPAQAGDAIVFGPYMQNFSAIAQEFLAELAAVQLQSDNEIAFAVDQLFARPEERERRGQAAKSLADQKRHILDQIVVELQPFLRA